ncbi:N/A [soil metagenome]
MIHSCIALLSFAAAVAATDKPNIIVIVADDLGYADLGFTGARDIPTPNLDALAKRGVVCTSGYVTHPFCSPTRAGLLTGRYQQRCGHENNPVWLPKDATVGLPTSEKTIADALKSKGYTTGLVGKWHLGAHPDFHPNRRGFDEFFGFLGGGHVYTLGTTKAANEYNAPIYRNDKVVDEKAYLTDALGREAAGFVTRHAKEPFFLYFAFNAPHTPMQPGDPHLAKVATITNEKRRNYAAMVVSVDTAVGQLTAALQEKGILDSTLIFFFSDNGGPIDVTACHNTPYRGGKSTLYEGGVRVPFVVSWPAMLKPGTFADPVSSLDVFATAAPNDRLEGVNLVPKLKKPDDSLAQRPLFWRVGGGSAFAMREGSWKYIARGKQPVELYDLTRDPAEKTNVAAMNATVVERMKTAVAKWNELNIAPVFGGIKTEK